MSLEGVVLIGLYLTVVIATYLGLLFTWFTADERKDAFPHGWSFLLAVFLPVGILLFTVAAFGKGMSALWNRR